MEYRVDLRKLCKRFYCSKDLGSTTICYCNTTSQMRSKGRKYFISIFLIMKNLKMLIMQHFFVPRFRRWPGIKQKSCRMDKLYSVCNSIASIHKFIINRRGIITHLSIRFVLIRRISDDKIKLQLEITTRGSSQFLIFGNVGQRNVCFLIHNIPI